MPADGERKGLRVKRIISSAESCRFFCALAMVVIAYGTAGAVATSATQARVDLSGDWVLDEPPAKKDGPRPPFCGRGCQIVQDERTLTVKVRNSTGTYRLDGVPVKTIERSGKYTAERTVAARWDGTRLLIVTQVGKAPERKLALSIKDGKLVLWSNIRGFEMSQVETTVTYSRRPKGLLVQLQ